jgi:hypothetical protein
MTAARPRGPRPGHGAFFVASGEDQQRLLERLIQQGPHRLDDQGEETLHVATAQADPAAVDFGQLQGVGLPQRAVIGHGVAVPGQYQAARATAETGQQVELAGADLLDITGKTQVAEPTGQQVDHRTVGLIQCCLSAAHRWRGDQRGKLILHGRQGHELSPGIPM